MSNNKIYLVILASGKGTRMGSKGGKMTLKIKDKSILEHCIDNFIDLNIFKEIIVVHNHIDLLFIEAVKGKYKDKPMSFIEGGNERYDSVSNALSFLLQKKASITDWVFVQDGARAYLPKKYTLKLYEETKLLEQEKTKNIKGLVLCNPMLNSVKKINSQGYIEDSEERSSLLMALTPQVFQIGNLQESINYCIQHNIQITDDAQAITAKQHLVKPLVVQEVIPKLTYTEDIEIFERLLS